MLQRAALAYLMRLALGEVMRLLRNMAHGLEGSWRCNQRMIAIGASRIVLSRVLGDRSDIHNFRFRFLHLLSLATQTHIEGNIHFHASAHIHTNVLGKATTTASATSAFRKYPFSPLPMGAAIARSIRVAPAHCHIALRKLDIDEVH